MNHSKSTRVLVAGALLALLPFNGEAKSYSSGGGRSYSSSSSHSSSGGSRSSSSASSRSSSTSIGSGAKSGSSPSSGASNFKSSSGKSYGSGSTSSDTGRKSYTSAKSYTSGNDLPKSSSASKPSFKSDSDSSNLRFDNAAARAAREEASRREFNRVKEAAAAKNGSPAPAIPGTSLPNNSSYRVQPPPVPNRRPTYVPDQYTIYSRPARMQTVFIPYVSRPVVVYRDSYNSLFWWWLLDRSLDDRAYWAYHHRYDMDPARYQALVADNRQLQERVEKLEAQRVARDPNYVPPDLDRDLMYTDHHVSQAYANRPTTSGAILFWLVGIPAAAGGCCFFIWLMFFKRWKTSTA